MSETKWPCSLSLSIGDNNGSGQSVIVDTVARAANVIGRINGFVYGEQFIVKEIKSKEVILGFQTREEKEAAVRNILKERLERTTDSCPDCGNKLIHQEGILLCRNCGYQSAPC